MAQRLEGWTFIPFYDCEGGDAGHVDGSIRDIYQRVNGNHSIVAFNTNGWCKRALLSKECWNKWTSDPTKGTYVRDSYHVS